VEQFFSHWGFKLPRFANPADKLSNIASDPHRELPQKPSIVEIAELVRVQQLEYIELATEAEKEIN
jgi:hypothetical protein